MGPALPLLRSWPVVTEPAVPHPALSTDDIFSRQWYHTIELPGGVVTPGEYDLRPVLRRLPLPASLAGQRCLDVGTHDGFWAFEMERRGAGEVVAIDVADPDELDWPCPRPALDQATREQLHARQEAFHLAHRALGSKVEHRTISVYDLTPEAVGRFDLAVMGTLLLHLRDPAGALMSVAKVLRGSLLVNDVVSLSLSALRPRTPAAKLLEVDQAPFWWLVNVAGLHRLLRSAGYEVEGSGGPYLVPNGRGLRLPAPSLRRQYGSSLLRQLSLRLGAPHAWVLGRPIAGPGRSAPRAP